MGTSWHILDMIIWLCIPSWNGASSRMLLAKSEWVNSPISTSAKPLMAHTLFSSWQGWAGDPSRPSKIIGNTSRTGLASIGCICPAYLPWDSSPSCRFCTKMASLPLGPSTPTATLSSCPSLTETHCATSRKLETVAQCVKYFLTLWSWWKGSLREASYTVTLTSSTYWLAVKGSSRSSIFPSASHPTTPMPNSILTGTSNAFIRSLTGWCTSA